MSEVLVTLPPPLEAILDDVSRAFVAKLYYPALVVCLTLPEVCCGLTMESSQFIKGPHYRKFIATYTDENELGVSPEECYRLRGGVLHRGGGGSAQIEGFSHIFFTIPETNGSVHGIHLNCWMGDALTLDLGEFCAAMVRAVHRWFEDNKDNSRVQQNLENIISPRTLDDWPVPVSGPIIGSGPL